MYTIDKPKLDCLWILTLNTDILYGNPLKSLYPNNMYSYEAKLRIRPKITVFLLKIRHENNIALALPKF